MPIEKPSYRKATNAEIFDFFGVNTDGGRRRIAYFIDHKSSYSYMGCGCCSDRSVVVSCVVCSDPTTVDENYDHLCSKCKSKGYYYGDDYHLYNNKKVRVD